jgi:DNA-binding NarL/FixJ family response regulator
MKTKLADCTTAIPPLTPAGTGGALLVRNPVITAALREYFEMLWERASPLAPQRRTAAADRPAPAQHAVLELMAEGLDDDAIACRAGISTTTVRRNIAATMERGRAAAGT